MDDIGQSPQDVTESLADLCANHRYKAVVIHSNVSETFTCNINLANGI